MKRLTNQPATRTDKQKPHNMHEMGFRRGAKEISAVLRRYAVRLAVS